MTKTGQYHCETKVNVRVPEGDLARLRQLIPSRFTNESDAIRHAIRQLLKEEGL
jgi:Arc/MetJ-type ribon-helix-helix transcriptional regulator